MNQSRRDFMITAATTGLALLFGGCVPDRRRGLVTTTDFQRRPHNLPTPENVKGHELRRVTEDDTRYALEGVVINGVPYYEQANTWPQPDESNTLLIRKADATLSIGKNARLVSDALYIPTLVRFDDRTLARGMPLNPTGRFGVKAHVTHYNTGNVTTGIFRETEDDRSFRIKTLTLGGKEFYVPRVEARELQILDEQIAQGEIPWALDFYMVPVQGTRKDIQDSGQIFLSSRLGIYRPIGMTRADYEARNPTPSTKSLTEENPGEAAGNLE